MCNLLISLGDGGNRSSSDHTGCFSKQFITTHIYRPLVAAVVITTATEEVSGSKG